MNEKLHDPKAQALNQLGLSGLAESFAISLARERDLLTELCNVRKRVAEHKASHELIQEALEDQVTLKSRCLNIRIPGTTRILYVGFRQGYSRATIEVLPLDGLEA